MVKKPFDGDIIKTEVALVFNAEKGEFNCIKCFLGDACPVTLKDGAFVYPNAAAIAEQSSTMMPFHVCNLGRNGFFNTLLEVKGH